MTYVTDQTSAELCVHMRKLKAMPGWHEPLADRLWKEVQDLISERDTLRAALQDKAGEVWGEREAFERWLGITPCGAAHDFGWQAWKARAAQPAPVVPDGFALVPVEATFDMRAAGNIELDRLKNTPGMLVADRAFYVWAAMIAASRRMEGSDVG